MDWKANQSTQTFSYQDSSLKKYDSLKNSHHKSAKILKPFNSNLDNRNTSLEINKPSKKQFNHTSIKEYCPLQVVRNHASRSQLQPKDPQIAQILKRNAYEFFNQERKKMLNCKKSHQYLLPKICMKSKRLYHPPSDNFQSTIYQKDSYVKDKINQGKYQKEKKARMKNNKEVVKSFDGQQPVQEARQKFKMKCEAEYAKICFNLPQNLQRKKCFFDLTQEEVSQLYSKSSVTPKPQQSQDNKENIEDQKETKKFKLLQMDSQASMIEQNNSIPLFLMERLPTSKDVFWTKQNSFVTDFPVMQKKSTQKIKIKHIL